MRVSRASRVSATFDFSSGQSRTTGSYCGEVEVTNTSATTVDGGWRVRLDLSESQLTSGWNGTFTSGGGSLQDLTPGPLELDDPARPVRYGRLLRQQDRG